MNTIADIGASRLDRMLLKVISVLRQTPVGGEETAAYLAGGEGMILNHSALIDEYGPGSRERVLQQLQS